MTQRVGALCAGYGGLELALRDVLDVELAWYAEKDPAAAKVLALRFPGVPNLGDITEIDWSKVEPVDIVTAGFPCQDVSLAGRRAGIAAGTRSGLWLHIAQGLAVLRPALVMLENVRGLLSARADSDVEPCPWCLGDDPDQPVLRALGAVLGDLAELGLDAEWVGLRAADVGACHGRFRVGLLAWPAADATGARRGGSEIAGADRGDEGPRLRGVEPERGGGAPAADPDGAGWEGREPAPGRLMPARGAAADAQGDGRDEWRPEPARLVGRLDAAERSAGVAPDADGIGSPRGGPAWGRGCGPEDSGGLGPDERQLRQGQPDAAGSAPGNAQGVGEQDQPIGGTAPGLQVEPVAGAVHRDRERGLAQGVHELGRAAPELAWGPYEPAIRRWMLILGRPAPAPTQPGTKGQPRLSPRFVEWMQGLPEGWVTDVPGVSRNDQLRILGNGVVPQQFSATTRSLLDRAFGPGYR